MLQPEQSHVRQKSVGRLAFESDAVCSTVALQKLSDSVERCIRENDSKSHQDFESLVQQCWTPSSAHTHLLPSLEGESEVLEAGKWELHCEALLALCYLQFCGGSIQSCHVEVHQCQFMVQWFNSCDDFLSSAAGVKEHLWTQSFVSAVLLHTLHTPYPLALVEDFIRTLRARTPSSKSRVPAWLQQTLAVDDPYLYLEDSLLCALTFQHNFPQVPSDERISSNAQCLSSIIKISSDYHVHKTPSALIDTLDEIIYSESIFNSSLQGCASWLKGLIAQDKSCFTLATACYRDAVQTWQHLPFVFFNACQAYLRHKIMSAALESLRLFVRACDDAKRRQKYLPFEAAVLRSLLPPPCPAAARALLMGVALRQKLYSDVLEQFQAPQNQPEWPSHPGEEDASGRRHLLRRDHLPPPCPPLAALRVQAALAAALLPRPALLEELLAVAEHDHTTYKDYYQSSYSSNCQVLLLSSLLRRVLVARQYLEQGRRTDAMKECARLHESMVFVLPAIPEGDDFSPLLALAPLVVRALVCAYLCHLHKVSGSETNALHFKHQVHKDVQLAMSFLNEGTSLASGVSSAVRSVETELDCENLEGGVDAELGAGFLQNECVKLPNEVIAFCESQNSRNGVDESTGFVVGNTTLFAVETFCSFVRENDLTFK